MVKHKSKDYIKMGFDPLFKKMFGDVNYTNKAAALVGIFLNIPFERIKDRVEILNNEKVRINKKDKPQEQDVLVHVRLKSDKYFVNLEANINGYNEEGINRNTGYIANTYSRQLDKKENYKDLEPVVQINFNSSSSRIKNKGLNRAIDTYLLRNKEGIVLTEMIKIINVDIDMCYDIWYNEDVIKFTSCEQNIIKIGALHKINNDEEFRKCLGEIDMDKEVKDKIQHDMDEYQQDKELAMVYDKEKHEEYIRQSKERDLDLYKKELDENKRQIDKEKQEVDKEKQEVDKEKQKVDKEKQEVDKEKQEVDKEKQEVDKEKQEVDKERLQIEQEKKQVQKEKIQIIRNLLNENIDIEKISKITGLSVKNIKEIEN